MTAKNIDSDKLTWSEPEDFSDRTREEFVQSAQGCWVKRIPWKPDENLIFTNVAIDPNRASRVYVQQTDDYIKDYLYKDTWQFAKIPQEAPEETNQPNAFPSDDVEKEEPEFITSDTDSGKWKIINTSLDKVDYEKEDKTWNRTVAASKLDVIYQINHGWRYRTKNPNFKPKKEPKRFDIWTYENDHGKALWLTQCTDEKHGGWDSLTYYRDQDRLAPVGRHWANQFDKLLGHTSDAEEAMKIISDYKINLSALTGGD